MYMYIMYTVTLMVSLPHTQQQSRQASSTCPQDGGSRSSYSQTCTVADRAHWPALASPRSQQTVPRSAGSSTNHY